MTRRSKVLSVVLLLVVVALGTLAGVLSHDSPCGATAPLPAKTLSMKAVVYRCYGGPEVVKSEDLAKPTPADDQLLVKVHASSVNPLDWHYMRGKPYVMRAGGSGYGVPEDIRLGVDFAGTVEAVGKSVQGFKPGDEVFGGADGSFAEYVTVRSKGSVVLKPANITFEQAAAVPIAAVTALQALRDKGMAQAGQKVLINGASGGVGPFAVQIAKALGAEVTAVCSTRNVAMARSLGADRVIDYTREDFTRSSQHYDLIIDSVGSHSLAEYRRVLTPAGKLVMVGGPSEDPWLGPLRGSIKALLLAPFVSQKMIFMLADLNQGDLETLRRLMASGKLVSVIDRRYELSDTAAAIGYLEQGHARGKVVIDVAGGASTEGTVLDNAAVYPEAPLWHNGMLFYVEYAANDIKSWDGSVRPYWKKEGCGPSGLIEFGKGHLLVACYDANSLLELDEHGREVRAFSADSAGHPFHGPNDFTADGHGGIYLSASGSYAVAAPITGTVLHLSAGGAGLTEVANAIHYPNGLTLSKDGKTLLVAEMLAGRILEFAVRADGSLGERRVWARMQDLAPPTPNQDAYNGPDGFKLGPDGNYYIAQNGSGRVLVVGEGRRLLRTINVAAPYVTNIAFGGDGARTVFVTGAFDQWKPPYQGAVYRFVFD
jgi:NADPH:quinone reductase-like Zn-dependent oxidoreductase/sugar lactone lactonase YvrE